MSASGQCVLQRVQQRNSDLPAAILRWATGHFYCYLSHKCYRWGQYSDALEAVRLTLLSDPANLLNNQVRAIGAWSFMHLMTHGRHRPHVTSLSLHHVPPRGKLFAQIETRRWATVLKATGQNNPAAPLTNRPVIPILRRWYLF
jgi:hypothetical protein